MKKSRVIWGLWLVLAVIFCFVTDGVTGYLLLAVSIVLPLLSGITLFAVRGKMDVQLIVGVPVERLLSLIRNVDCVYGFSRFKNRISMMHIDKGQYLEMMEG